MLAMIDLLKPFEDQMDKRFTLYRRMCAHVGISSTETPPKAHKSYIRAALMSCTSCHETECCAGWLDLGHAGIPYVCRARSIFQELSTEGRDRADDTAQAPPAGARTAR